MWEPPLGCWGESHGFPLHSRPASCLVPEPLVPQGCPGAGRMGRRGTSQPWWQDCTCAPVGGSINPAPGGPGQGGHHPSPTTPTIPHGSGLSALDPLLPLGQKLGREEKEDGEHRGHRCFRKRAQSDTRPRPGGGTQLPVSPPSPCGSSSSGPRPQTLHFSVWLCAPQSQGTTCSPLLVPLIFLPEPPAGEWSLRSEPRSVGVDGQRPFPAALETFTARDTWALLKPWGSQVGEAPGSHFWKKESSFCFLFAHWSSLLRSQGQRTRFDKGRVGAQPSCG